MPRPFVVIATQNPVEQEGTYRLPEAQLDRFLHAHHLGYPDHDHEVDVLRDARRRPAGPRRCSRSCRRADVRTMIAGRRVGARRGLDLAATSCALCAATRAMPELRLGRVDPRRAWPWSARPGRWPPPRAARSSPPTTSRIVAPAVMGHRMLLTPEAELGGVETTALVDDILDRVELPAAMRQGA